MDPSIFILLFRKRKSDGSIMYPDWMLHGKGFKISMAIAILFILAELTFIGYITYLMFIK